MNIKEYRSVVSDRLNSHVKILKKESTSNIMFPIIHAIRECRQTFDKSDTEFTSNDFALGVSDELAMKYCIEHLHNSVFEHIIFTFEIDMSRVAHLQLVRHRISSFSAESARACAPEKYYTPQTVSMNEENMKIFLDSIQNSEKAYNQLMKNGIKAEDARYVLPLAMMSFVQYTANLSSLRNAIAERTCKTAQKEIRDIFNTIKKYLTNIHPILTYRVEKYHRCPDSLKCGFCIK